MIEAVKDIIRQTTGLPDPVLHALIGLGVYGVSVAVLRQSLRSWVPWLIVLGLQLINEAADIVHDWLAYSDIEVRGTFWDTVITMCLPTMLVVCARFVRPPAAGQRS